MDVPEPKLRELFSRAAECPTAQEQAAYLDQACQDDAELRARLENLLQAHREAGSFLQEPSGAMPPSPVGGEGLGVRGGATIDVPASAERPGTVIGPYKLLQQIGEGGMGVVWMAEQTHPVQRKVALKVIKPGMDSRQVIARFEAERQALAMMDHVNIARVFDGGTTGTVASGQWPVASEEKEGSASLATSHWPLATAGRPYFVMELVHGVPITKYCDDNHLTPRERLELFVPVCQAIQHAHQKGIIHRDIKPSNVMVTLYDGKPVPKVIDFGVAKATEQKLTERTLFTQYGAMVGTLEYMSPEQAEMSALGVDTRSDIYSLGVLLYELLTGSTPLTHKRMKEAAYAEILRMIKEEEPQKPSTRLSTTEELASIAANRGVEPRKLSGLVRGELDWIVMKTLEKDRNRRYETANGFAMDVQRYLADEPVQACPPSAGYRLRKFARRNKRVLAATAVLGVALLVAVGTVAGSLGWVARDRAARQAAVEQEVNIALKEAARLQGQEKWPEALSAAKRAEGLLAGSGSDELRDQVEQVRKDLEMVLRLEEIPLLWSEIKENKRDFANADGAYAKAFADYGIDVAGLPAEEAGTRIRARHRIADALSASLDDWVFVRSQNDLPAGRALSAAAQAADPDPWRRQVREAQKDGKKLAALAGSPDLLRKPPISLLMLARSLRFRGLLENAVEVLRQAQRQYPGDFWINQNLAWALHAMGPAYRDEGISFLRAALAVRPHNVLIHDNLGQFLGDHNKLDEAILYYNKALEIDSRYANSHINLGVALSRQNKLDEAVACLRKAIELDRTHPKAHYNLGAVLVNQCNLSDSFTDLKRAIDANPTLAATLPKLAEAAASFKKATDLDPKDVDAYVGLGRVLRFQGHLDEALANLQKAIDLKPGAVEAWFQRGLVHRDLQQYDKARADFAKVIELQPDHGDAWWWRHQAYQRQSDRAVADYTKVIDLNPNNATAWRYRGTAHWGLRQYDRAMADYTKAVELKPDDAQAWYKRGMLHTLLKQYDQAIADYSKAVESKPNYVEAWCKRARVFRSLKQWDKAIADMSKAVELSPGSFEEELRRLRAEAAEMLGIDRKKD